MSETDLERYKEQLHARLASIAPVFAKASIGDFSKDVEIPDEEDELTEFFVGVQIILNAIRDQVKELEATVNELRSANEIIETQKAQAEAVLESLGDCLITTDHRYDITFINALALDFLGLTEPEVLGRSGLELINLEDDTGALVAKEHHPLTRAVLLNRKVASTLAKGDAFYMRRNGQDRRRIALTVTPIKHGAGTSGSVMVFRDITEENNINRAKSEIISIASHQLLTPLATVKWYVEELVATQRAPDPERQLKYLLQVQESNERMIELVDHLLSVSRIELGTMSLRPEAVDLVKLLEQELKDLDMQIHTRKLVVETMIEDGLPQALVDKNSMRVILQNLLSNAVRYSPPGKQITASLRSEPGGRILITVADNGCGIPEQDQGRIFSKLFRAQNAQGLASDGSGLGLYVTKAMVEQSGGKIWFESTENKGTTFYVIIPAVVD